MKFTVGNQEFDIADDVLAKSLEEKKTVLELAKDVVVRTTDDDNRFVENHKKEARKEGVEIAVKKVRESMGLTFEGKTIENLVSSATEKALSDAKLNPDERIKDINKKLTEKDDALKVALKKAEDAESSVKTIKAELRIDRELEASMPKNTLLPAEDIKTILKSKMSFKENETGVLEAYDSNGKLISNPSTRDALSAKDAIEEFFRNNTHYVKANEGGSGGGDSSGKDGKISIDKFITNMKEKNIEINSAQYQAELDKLVKEDKIDLD